ncbi:MAG TPA: PVC-type heme-binding CxxCH protein [Planctomycetota bacterium]|nr:PVC-type heme-binding CxxCH protein [Planctomycetota bacterium]
MRFSIPLSFLFCVLTWTCVSGENAFRAGIASVDISPQKFPVRVNGGFTSREAGKLLDTLEAKALALDDGKMRIVIVLVDSCMLPRTLIDEAKELAAKTTKIPTENMLVAATHTHSAPSAMGCLGTPPDDVYPQLLPGKISQVIENAVAALQPAKVGWGSVQAPEYTNCRRWIRRFDKLLTDPFGEKNVKANMHPGYLSPDAIGPSGPVDSELGILSVQTADGKPLALLANYSMHYFGAGMLSSDYFGRFAKEVARRIAPQQDANSFLVIMSQGTSGDLYWADYSKPAKSLGMDEYAAAMAAKAQAVYEKIKHQDSLTLAMREAKLTLGFRLADEKRMAWAKSVVAGLNGRLPKTIPEVYAHEQIFLAERPTAELKLQAVRIGDMAFTAIPNEVYSITGLKLKAQSPLKPTFNIELANGSEGYIPPPEQHTLGGYTTWPARTAGLEVQAEPRIVEALLKLLEDVSGKPRQKLIDTHGAYAENVLKAKPLAYYRLNEISLPQALDASGNGRHAQYEEKIALYLSGPDSAAFSGEAVNRAPHFAGGRLRAPAKPGGKYSVSFWLWNGLPKDVRDVAGYAFSYGADKAAQAPGDHLAIGGKAIAGGKVLFFNGDTLNQVLEGKTEIPLKTWVHVALVRDGKNVIVYLNGKPEITGEAASSVPAEGAEFFFGGRNDHLFDWEGKLDEAAIFDRVLSADEVAAQFAASGMPGIAAAPEAAPKTPAQNLKAPTPQEALAALRVKDGFEVQLVAAEPLTLDPVAFDWGPDGRLWVAEMADYPLGMDGKMKPGGRIRVLEDTNGDGVYDKSTLFMDDVRMPTGIMVWRGGVLVSAAPEIIFASDTNGDGKADERKVLYSGFKEGNPQLRVNALRWGLDGWVYCANGWSNGTVKSAATGESVDISGRDLRIQPDTGRMETISGVTQFGRERDDFDHWFGVNNSFPVWHYVLNERYAKRNPHVPALDPIKQLVLPRNPKIFPIAPPEKRYHSFNEAGRFTSACSTMIYRDEFLFPASADMHAFTCEPFHSLMHHEILRHDGVSFSAQRPDDEKESEFLASSSRWFKPVMVRMGPDGALWVADMCRLMIEHPEWLPAEGKAEMAPIYRAGEDTGRIFRIVPKNAARRAIPNLSALTPAQLTARLSSANGFERDLVQRMLLWRADKMVEPELAKIARSGERPASRAQALWTLHCLGETPADVLIAALSDASPAVREQAVRIAEFHGEKADVRGAALKLAGDPDAKVRLQLAWTAGTWKEAEAGKALASIALRDVSDKYITAAVLSSAVPHCAALSSELLAAGPAGQAYFEPLLNTALATQQREALAVLLRGALAAPEKSAQMNALSVLLEAIRRRGASLEKLRSSAADALTTELEKISAIRENARTLAAASDTEASLRAAAVRLLGYDNEQRESAAEILKPLLAPQTPTDLQLAAVKSLARLGGERVPENLLGGWNTYGPSLRSAIADELLSRDEWALALLKSIEAKKVAAMELDAQRRERLLKHKTAAIKDQAKKLFAATVNEDRQKVVDAFTPALKLTPNRDNGVKIFARACIACHKLDGVGQEIGPDLRSVAAHAPEKLLASILDPSRAIEPGYMAFACVLNSGEQVYGLITAESGASISMKLADNTMRSILRSEIKVLRGTNVSLMPEGLEAGLSQQDIADLIHYLRTPTTTKN